MDFANNLSGGWVVLEQWASAIGGFGGGGVFEERTIRMPYGYGPANLTFQIAIRNGSSQDAPIIISDSDDEEPPPKVACTTMRDAKLEPAMVDKVAVDEAAEQMTIDREAAEPAGARKLTTWQTTAAHPPRRAASSRAAELQRPSRSKHRLQLVKLLHALEDALPWSAMLSAWGHRQRAWMARLETMRQGRGGGGLAELVELTQQLEKSVKQDALADWFQGAAECVWRDCLSSVGTEQDLLRLVDALDKAVHHGAAPAWLNRAAAPPQRPTRPARKATSHHIPPQEVDRSALGLRLVVWHVEEMCWYPGKVAEIDEGAATTPYLVVYDDGAHHWHALSPHERPFEWLPSADVSRALPPCLERLPAELGAPASQVLNAMGVRLGPALLSADGSSETCILDLCDYGLEGYSVMTLDANRNAFFASCLAACAHEGGWLEVGCGAAACLTKMLLAATERTVVALEASPAAAASARRLLDGEPQFKELVEKPGPRSNGGKRVLKTKLVPRYEIVEGNSLLLADAVAPRAHDQVHGKQGVRSSK